MSQRTVAFTAQRLLQTLQSQAAANAYVVGFSGGADSTALLHALNEVKYQLKAPISAIHVNHGLHTDANMWQSHCKDLCRQYAIPLNCLRVNLGHESGKGLEAEARELRYRAISNQLESGACLLTAHHADDQAETLLLNLMRGSGVDGLSAMPVSRTFGDAVILRPLLGFQNSALKTYLRDQNIGWIDDPSNQQLDQDRNFVRHQVIPLLEQRWPEVSKRLLLTRKAMSDTRKLLEKMADDHLQENLAHPQVLNIATMTGANPELFKLVIRRWLKRAGATSVPVYQLESFYQQVQAADSDSRVNVTWQRWIMRLYKQQLWLHPDHELLPCPVVKWAKGEGSIDLGDDIGQLVLLGDDPVLPAGDFSVGARCNLGETVLGKGIQHKSLKNLFQSAAIPPWLRNSVPLISLGAELVAMGDWCIDPQFESRLAKTGTRLNWRPRNPLLQFILSQQNAAKP